MVWPPRVVQLAHNYAFRIRDCRFNVEAPLNQVLAQLHILRLHRDAHVTVDEEAGLLLLRLRRTVSVLHIIVAYNRVNVAHLGHGVWPELFALLNAFLLQVARRDNQRDILL
jgi:hypothetical protein